ncbi:hypothetical protein ccbrp13_56540 [Ktedonobacteria bacterium brp13]|nr:hypothetical protein ccbrp13_56540 [Ktedonobacteria bacterium brp13]
MRNEKKEYWGADLPKDSEALQELDAFANEQGMISRTDATRMILIAWAKARQGKDTSIWPGAQPVAQSSQSVQQNPVRQPLQGARQLLNANALAVDLD